MKARQDDILPRIQTRLTREEALGIWAQGKEAVIFALLELSLRAAGSEQAQQQASGPHTPSGSIPPYQKPPTRKRGKKPGAKPGHAGRRRPAPESISRQVQHPPLTHCPDCGARVRKSRRSRTRYIEDVPEVQPEVTEHIIPRHWCPVCKKSVEPVVDEALPRATFGHRLLVLTAWLHYGLGLAISQVTSVLAHHVHLALTAGGLVGAWRRVGQVLGEWYDQIGEQVRDAGVLHADETGWRVQGKPHWLWCFTTRGATYYMIDRSRGSPALQRFFTSIFKGVLVTDFWAAYGSVWCADRQACLAHLLREIADVDAREDSPAWAAFSTKLKRLLRDGLRLKHREDLNDEVRGRRVRRIDQRLTQLVEWQSEHKQVRRIVKRLKKHRDALFTFLDYADVPADNNHAEREIRPAVMMRKRSQGNRSDSGAHTQAILMSIYRTLEVRGYEPLDTIVEALKTYVRTGKLPPLPT